MNKFVIGVTVFILGALGWLWYTNSSAPVDRVSETDEATPAAALPELYTCADDVMLETSFAADGETVELVTPAGKQVSLEQRVAASGVQYENADGSVVFFTKGSEGFLEESGSRSAEACVAVPVDGTPPDVSGETSDAQTTLQANGWQWVETEQANGEVVTPEQVDAFSLLFQDTGQVAIQTDCNTMMGQYTVPESGTVHLSEMAATLMYCEGSQESEFQAMLEQVDTYERRDGQLLLQLTDGGVMYFEVLSDPDES